MNNLSNLSKESNRLLLEQQALALRELERRVKQNPLKWSKQHPKQVEASQALKAIRALFWGNRVGKTEWGGQETAKYALGEHLLRKVIQPIEIWCACPSYDQQKETTQKKLEYYIPAHRIVHKTMVKSGVWGEIRLDTGARINFKSYEQGREKFQGAGKRLIWFDEEPPKDIWEECFVRSEAGVPLDIILTMTPINGMTWVYDEIYLDTSNPDLFVSEADWDDNPFLGDSQKKQMARGLTPEALEVRKKGKFVKKTGMVLPWWQRSVHAIDMLYSKDWIVSGAIDFGFSNPACFGLIGVDYDDNLNIFDGFYRRGLTTPKIAETIDQICAPYGIDPKEMLIIADSAQAESIQALNDMGYNVIGIRKQSGTDGENWDEYRASKMQEYGEIDKDGKTKFHVSNKLMTFDEKLGMEINWFAKEAGNLKWAEVASAVGREKQQGGTWDIRYPNHAVDMFSYFLVDHLDKPNKPDPRKPWEGKIPGTYVPPSVPSEDENDWGSPEQIEEVDDF